MAYATMAGSPLLVLMGLPVAWGANWGLMTPLHWALMLWATLVSSFAGWLVWGWVNTQRGIGRTAPLQYLMPLVAGVFAWWATGERFSAAKIGGAALTLAGVAPRSEWVSVLKTVRYYNPAHKERDPNM